MAPSGERWIFPYRGEGLSDDPAPFPPEQAGTADAVLVDYRHPRICAAAVDQNAPLAAPTASPLAQVLLPTPDPTPSASPSPSPTPTP